LEVLAVGRYVSEAWFGRQLARHPPANRRASNAPARPELTRPAGMTLITTGTVLLAVSIPLPFLNVKLLGLIMIVAGLVKVRALQRASGWLWQNRRVRNGPTRPLAGPAPALGHGQPEPVRQARPELTRPAGMTLIPTGTVLLLAVSIPLPFLNVKLLGLFMIVAGLLNCTEDRQLAFALRQLGWQVRRPDDLMVSYTPVTRHLVVLLPAHNEERDIGTALEALTLQTRMPDKVIVIADNCTDDTARIAVEHGATVMKTSGNAHRKAGALNYALERILPRLTDTDAVLVQDADSYLDPRFVEVTMKKLDEGYDAAGGNFRAREGGGPCGWFQRNEYARYARDNARKRGRVLCLTGVGTMFTVRALRAVATAIADGTLPDAGGGYCYSYATLTEDNWMTLALKHLGFRFISPKDATMSTEPMLTWRGLGRQRLRWKRGAFEDLLSYGLTRHTLKGWGLFVVSAIGVFVTLIYIATLVASPWLGFHPKLWFVSLMILFGIERAATVSSRGTRTQLLAATVFPEWFYDLFLQGVQIRALAAVVWRTKKHW
jgi:cellulose synthase/poly-beta-1,6-N-acetylglucosamine synthase-like glycosyltransferase